MLKTIIYKESAAGLTSKVWKVWFTPTALHPPDLNAGDKNRPVLIESTKPAGMQIGAVEASAMTHVG